MKTKAAPECNRATFATVLSIALDRPCEPRSTTQIVPDSIQPQSSAQKFDERSALEELERLADKIQISRRRREQKVAEFDAFVRGFRHDRLTASIAASERESRRANDPPSTVSRATHAARGVVPPPVDAGGDYDSTAARMLPGAVEDATWGVAVPREPVARAVLTPPARPWAAYVGLGLAGAAVIGVGVLVWRSAGAPVGPEAPVDPKAVVAPAPAAPVATAPAAAAPTPSTPAGPPRALNIEFVTVRPVWARITVDGRRAAEREFAADQRLMFGADRAIAIRAGDAGALRLIVDGRDLGVLGRDGQVFDRVFTPAAR